MRTSGLPVWTRIPHFTPRADQVFLVDQPGRIPTRPGFFVRRSMSVNPVHVPGVVLDRG